MKKPRVILADDHTLMMEGLKSLLAGHVDLVGTVTDGRALLVAAERLKPDLVILDITMPGLNGIEAARQLRKDLPRTKLIILTMHGDPSYVEEAFRLGVSGYVLKSSALACLVESIDSVLRGKKYVSPSVRVPSDASRPQASADGHKKPDMLAARQREVLQLVAEGRSAKEIASSLHISVKTADFHKSNIMQCLGLHSTAELTKYAVRHGVTEG